MVRPAPRPARLQRGASLIEVLVTLLLLAFGLFGLVGLHARMQASEMEAYQRSQALVLLQDMASRIAINRLHAADYVTAQPVGAGTTCGAPTGTRQQIDVAQWCAALQGAAERSGTSAVGTVIGGRGCVQAVGATGANEYLVTVAWQGLAPVAAPPAGVTCGKDAYDGSSGPCVNDLCRRTITTLVRIGNLS
ncbi:pilus assembly protein [Xenophilus aerolatus]|nr:pilus assembly protein [Xenophilus aerolatus]